VGRVAADKPRHDALTAPGGRWGDIGRWAAAEAEIFPGGLQAIVPQALYIELMRHGHQAEERIEALLLEMAYAPDLPLVATI